MNLYLDIELRQLGVPADKVSLVRTFGTKEDLLQSSMICPTP